MEAILYDGVPTTYRMNCYVITHYSVVVCAGLVWVNEEGVIAPLADGKHLFHVKGKKRLNRVQLWDDDKLIKEVVTDKDEVSFKVKLRFPQRLSVSVGKYTTVNVTISLCPTCELL